MSPTVKTLKTLDYIIQLGLIIGSTLYTSLSITRSLSGGNPFLAYFIVGGWQIMSVLAHLSYSPSYKSKLRRIYLIILAIVLVALCVGFVVQVDNIMLTMLFGLLIVSPLQAILYVVTCIQETKQWSSQASVGPDIQSSLQE